MANGWFWAYRFLLAPLAEALLRAGGPVGGAKWREFLRDKNRRRFKFNGTWDEVSLREARPVWFHAASGEVEYARPVIREWARRHPNIPVLVTFTSPSAKRILQGLEGVAAWGPAPWERARAIRFFLNRFRPRAALFARTDVWPLLADEIHAHGIPSLLFSATFADGSTRLRGPARALTSRALSRLSEIFAVSARDLEHLTTLPTRTPASARGDTRYDQVGHRLAHPRPLATLLVPDDRPVLVAGSSWPEDERVILEALRSLPNWRLVLVPHETSRAREVADACEIALARPQLYSAGGRWTSRVLVVDAVGVLAELYQHGRVAFVGGSFRRLVHSVMEPIAAGLPVLVGPFHHNNREALELKNVTVDGQPVVREVTDATSFAQALTELTTAPPPPNRIRDEIEKRSGASLAVVRWIEEFQLRS